MPSEPADQVIGGLDQALVGLVDVQDLEESKSNLFSVEGQVVRLLRWQVRPALADLEGEGRLELLGAVGPGFKLLGYLWQWAGLGFLGRPAGANRKCNEGQHHPQPKGVPYSRMVHLPRPLP